MPLGAAKQEALIRSVRAAFPDVVGIYVYGSLISGGRHPSSDLDIALLLPETSLGEAAPARGLPVLAGQLESIVGCPVDISILDLERIVHCKEVVAGGSSIYVADERALGEFEMRVLATYARFREDAAPVWKAYG